MADPRDPKESGGSYLAGAVSGGLLGLLVGAFIMGGVGYPLWKKKFARSAYENMVPVVVASEDIPEGTVLTFDIISQRSIPGQFVTESVVKPDNVSSILGKHITAPVRAGDTLLWSQFQNPKQANGLVAARDIPVGDPLKAEDVEDREMPPSFVTPSFVRQSERPQIVGRTVTAAFRKGDPILWTHLQTAERQNP